jgi:hypothetical protein
LTASGTISVNSSGDATIPVGTSWEFELTYDTAAPDLDFELTESPDPTFGRFKNTGTPPALRFFHYRAGTYEVTMDDSADFGEFSDIHITFTSINAIDVNIHAPAHFPPLAGGPVGFHADFNAFTTAPIFLSDSLPTNTALSPASFDDSAVTLLPQAGVVTSSVVTSLSLTAAADFDKDGDVDGADLLIWQSGVGLSDDALPSQGDANRDRTVNADDLEIWRAQFGQAPQPGEPLVNVVAEPCTGGMAALIVCSIACVGRRWRRSMVACT